MSAIHFHQNKRGTIDSTPCEIEECPRLVPAGQPRLIAAAPDLLQGPFSVP